MKLWRPVRRITIVDIDRSFWRTILIDEDNMHYMYRHWYVHPSREARTVEKKVRQLKIRDQVEFQFRYVNNSYRIGEGNANKAVIYMGCLNVPKTSV